MRTVSARPASGARLASPGSRVPAAAADLVPVSLPRASLPQPATWISGQYRQISSKAPLSAEAGRCSAGASLRTGRLPGLLFMC